MGTHWETNAVLSPPGDTAKNIDSHLANFLFFLNETFYFVLHIYFHLKYIYFLKWVLLTWSLLWQQFSYK